MVQSTSANTTSVTNELLMLRLLPVTTIAIFSETSILAGLIPVTVISNIYE